MSKLREEHGLSVFIDIDHTAYLTGYKEHVREKLAHEFQNNCALIVAIISADWIDSEWCHDEFQTAFARIKARKQNCFLPIKIRHLDKRKEIDLEEHFVITDLTKESAENQGTAVGDKIKAFFDHQFQQEAPAEDDESPTRIPPLVQPEEAPNHTSTFVTQEETQSPILPPTDPEESSIPAKQLSEKSGENPGSAKQARKFISVAAIVIFLLGFLVSAKIFKPQFIGQDYSIPELDLDMIWVNPGTFMMGSPASEEGRDDDETQHEVKLTKGFWLGKYEVTQGQWKAIMDGDNPSYYKDDEHSDQHPVENISWDDSQKFIERLNSNQEYLKLLPEGYEYRLPTEAEWEYACRAGTESPYNGPNGESLSELGWYEENSSKKTHSVGGRKANAWGLYDMHGNVWEWCHDWYGPYSSGPVSDPSGPDQGTDRVIRGGSWISDARDCRSAYRGWVEPAIRFFHRGFRLGAGPVIPD